VIDEGVFCPTLTNASALLLQLIDFKPSERVLDAFAGSGAFGINAALHGADVIAFDISPIAVACAEKNAGINRVAHRTDVRQCTVRHISPQQEAFDLVIANPPLLPGVQTGVLGPAVFDPQLAATIEFVEALGTILADGGRCFLLTSDVFDRIGYDMNRLCAESRLVNEIVAQADVGYETYRVHRIVRRKQ
jgi:methylase of polypeptide subunit release factors